MNELTEKVLKALKRCLSQNGSSCEGCAYMGTACTDHLLKDCNVVILDLQKQALEKEKSAEIHNDARLIDELYNRLIEVCRHELISFEDLSHSTILSFARDTYEELDESSSTVPSCSRAVMRQRKLLYKFLKKWSIQNVSNS